jgi:hypothetical protein
MHLREGERAALAAAFEQRFRSLVGRGLLALAAAAAASRRLREAALFWQHGARRRCFDRWRDRLARRAEAAAMAKKVALPLCHAKGPPPPDLPCRKWRHPTFCHGK